MSKYYNATEAGNLLGVTTMCVSSLIKRKRLKAEWNKQSWKIEPTAIIDYINLRTTELNKEEQELKEILKLLK